MDFMKMGVSLLTEHFGGDVSDEQADSALSGLIGDGDGGIDIAGLIEKFTSGGGLGDMVGSWLGDGENEGVDPTQLLEMFGGDKIAEFASNLGVDQESATQGLSDILPQLLDQGSAGGDLLESVGGLDSVFDFVKKLF